MMYYLYILYNILADTFYIGQTYDLRKRLEEHTTGKSRYTKRFKEGWKLVYYEKLPTRSDAMARERYFKSLKNKEYIKKFIKNARA